MKQEPRIEHTAERIFVGKKLRTNLFNNTTQDLWAHFMPRVGQISNRIGQDFFNLQIYPNGYYQNFNPITAFDAYALIEVSEVWSASGESGASWLRKWERTLFFTFEFVLKAGYGQLIEWAAQASYEAPIEKIYLTAVTSDTLPALNDLDILIKQDSALVMGITRWGAFTETIEQLAEYKIEVIDIAGNDEIVVSIVMNREKELNIHSSELLYNSAVVTDEHLKRCVYVLPVNELLPFIRSAVAEDMFVEHVFDY